MIIPIKRQTLCSRSGNKSITAEMERDENAQRTAPSVAPSAVPPAQAACHLSVAFRPSGDGCVTRSRENTHPPNVIVSLMALVLRGWLEASLPKARPPETRPETALAAKARRLVVVVVLFAHISKY